MLGAGRKTSLCHFYFHFTDRSINPKWHMYLLCEFMLEMPQISNLSKMSCDILILAHQADQIHQRITQNLCTL